MRGRLGGLALQPYCNAPSGARVVPESKGVGSRCPAAPSTSAVFGRARGRGHCRDRKTSAMPFARCARKACVGNVVSRARLDPTGSSAAWHAGARFVLPTAGGLGRGRCPTSSTLSWSERAHPFSKMITRGLASAVHAASPVAAAPVATGGVHSPPRRSAVPPQDSFRDPRSVTDPCLPFLASGPRRSPALAACTLRRGPPFRAPIGGRGDASYVTTTIAVVLDRLNPSECWTL